MYFRVREHIVVDELFDERELVVVDDGHLMAKTRVAADMLAVTVLLELFCNDIGTEEPDVGELRLLIDH